MTKDELSPAQRAIYDIEIAKSLAKAEVARVKAQTTKTRVETIQIAIVFSLVVASLILYAVKFT